MKQIIYDAQTKEITEIETPDEERFKEVEEEPIIAPVVPTIEERLQMAEDTIMFILTGGV